MALWAHRQSCKRLLQQRNGFSQSVARQLTGSNRIGQASLAEESVSRPRIKTFYTSKSSRDATSPEFDSIAPAPKKFRTVRKDNPFSNHAAVEDRPGTERVSINVGDYSHTFSPLLLRDLCACSRCIDASTKQKHFATADIPSNIHAKIVKAGSDATHIRWENDIPGYGSDHVTQIPTLALRQLTQHGQITHRHATPPRVLWNAQMFRGQTHDIEYDSYMQDDAVLLKAIHQLHAHGLLFITNVPGDEKSVEAVGERIGPLKTTFYGRTWDVRSVPEAINVAYTAQNLGFHTDLMYMEQPPHIQLLHCIRASNKGGASLFSDSFKAAHEIAMTDKHAWEALTRINVDYHYDHPGSQYYHQARPVVKQRGVQLGNRLIQTWEYYQQSRDLPMTSWWPELSPVDFIDHVSWSPPFQAPFSNTGQSSVVATDDTYVRSIASINSKIEAWHAAARKFNELIHKPEVIYERLMRPGDCVIFDNRRVLHARRNFEVGDAGTERWLRGAYIDKDPYMSKMKVLTDI